MASFKRMSVPFILTAFCFYFIGAVSFDICNRMLSRIVPIDPELMGSPQNKDKGLVPRSNSRDAAHVDPRLDPVNLTPPGL